MFDDHDVEASNLANYRFSSSLFKLPNFISEIGLICAKISYTN